MKNQGSCAKVLFDCFIPREVHSSNFLIILEILSQIQILSNLLIFIGVFNDISQTELISTSVSSLLEKTSSNLTRIDKIPSGLSEIILLAIFILILLILCLLTFTLVLNFRIAEVSLARAHLIKLIFNIYSKVLVLPITSFMVQILRNTFSQDFTIFGRREDRGLTGLILLFLALNLLIALLPGFLNFQPMKTSYLFSHRPCSIDFLDIIFKIIYAVLPIWRSDSEIFSWLFASITFLILGLKMNIVIKLNPFHHLNGQMIMLGFFAAQISSNLLNLGFLLLNNNESSHPLMLQIVLVPLMTQALLMYYKIDLEKEIFSTSENICQTHAKILAFGHVMEANSIISKSNSTKFTREDFIFMNILKTHSFTCETEKCYCNFFTKKLPYKHVQYLSNLDNDLNAFKFNIQKKFYLDIINTGGEMCNIWITLDFIALVLTLQPEAYSIVLDKIFRLKLDRIGFIERFFIRGMISRIILEINTTIIGSNAQLDANLFFKFKSQQSDFKSSLADTTDQTLGFCKMYRSPNPKFMNLYQQSREINQKFAVISKKWLELKFYYGQLLFKEYRMYASFLALVQNSTKASRELVFQFNSFVKHKASSLFSAEHITRNSVQEERNIVVSVNMNIKNLGQVVSVTPNIKHTLGWLPSEMVGSNINKIIPHFFRDQHNGILEKHLETGRSSFLLRNNLVFAEHRQGYVIPTYLYITPYPDLAKGFHYMAVLRTTKRKYEYIILDEKSTVLAWTQAIGKEVGLAFKASLQDATNLEDPDTLKMISYLIEIKKELNEPANNSLKTMDQEEVKEDRTDFTTKSGNAYQWNVEKSESLANIAVYVLILEKKIYKNKRHQESDDCENLTKDFPIHICNIVWDPTSSIKSSTDLKATKTKNFDSLSSAHDQITKAKTKIERLNETENDNSFLSSDKNSTCTEKEKDFQEFYNVYQQSMSAASSMTSRKSNQWRECHEIDLLIQDRPKARGMTFLTIFLVVNTLITMITTIGMNTYASDLVNQNAQIAIIMRDSTLRLYYYLEIHRKLRISMMIAEELIDNQFNTSNLIISDYQAEVLGTLKKLNSEFSMLNNALVNSIHILDQSLITELFKNVKLAPRHQDEPSTVVPLSGAAYEYIQTVVSLENLQNMTSENTEGHFILKNTLNDILIRSEEIPQILLNAVKTLDDKVQNILFLLLICLVGVILVLAFTIIRSELKYAKEKYRFIFILMRCDEREIDQSLGRLKDFYDALEPKIDSMRYSLINHDQALSFGKTKKRSSRNKRVNIEGISNSSLQRIIVSVLLLCAALAPLVASILIFEKFTTDITNFNTLLVTNDNLLVKYVLSYIGVYEYVSLNMTTTLRGKPITEELGKDIMIIKDNFDFFNRIKTGDQVQDDLISSLVSGNLCAYFADKIEDHLLCSKLGEGSPNSGIFAVTSYLTQILTSIKSEFDESDRSLSTIKRLLNMKQLRDAEIIFDMVFQLPFFQVDAIMIDTIKLRTDSFQFLTKVIDVVCVLVTLFFGVWGFKVYYIDGIAERRNIRLMLKLFPPIMLKNQGKIKNYIVSDAGNMFDS